MFLHFVLKLELYYVVQAPSHFCLFATPWTTAHQASLSFTISWSLHRFMSIASLMPSSHLILWCPLLLLPSIFPSIRDFSNELAVHIRLSKYWSFRFSSSPSNEYSGLTSFTIDWFDLLSVQGTLRSLLSSTREIKLQNTDFLKWYLVFSQLNYGLPWWPSDKESACNAGTAGDAGSIPGSERSTGGEDRQPTPVFLTGESHGQRNLVGYSP